MTRVWSWIKQRWLSLVGVLVAILTLGIITQKAKKAWRDRLAEEDRNRLSIAEQRIASLRAIRSEIEKAEGDHTSAIEELDRRIEGRRRSIRDVMKRGAGLSAEEIEKAFAQEGL